MKKELEQVREALSYAIAAMQWSQSCESELANCQNAVETLDKLIAAQAQEPVAWLYTLEYGGKVCHKKASTGNLNYPFGVDGADYPRENDDGVSYVRQTPLYTTPQPASQSNDARTVGGCGGTTLSVDVGNPMAKWPFPQTAKNFESLLRDMTTIAAGEVPKGVTVREFAMHALADTSKAFPQTDGQFWTPEMFAKLDKLVSELTPGEEQKLAPEFCCELAWKVAHDAAWNKVLRKAKCKCDPHVETCDECFPPEFREGGRWHKYKPEQKTVQRLTDDEVWKNGPIMGWNATAECTFAQIKTVVNCVENAIASKWGVKLEEPK